jgi:hypothetical protein
MPTTRKRGATVAVATLGLLLSGALTGCSLSKDDDGGERDTAAAPEPTPTPTEESTEESTETATPAPTATPTPTGGASSAAAGTPEAALLPAAELPALNASSPWTEKGTTVPAPTTFGVCQQFDLLSIGAMNIVERTFTGGAGDTAGQQVAEYPDAQNTVRASKVLEAWHDKCKGQVKGSNVKVGAITSTPVTKGKGWWYTVSWNRGGTGHFHTFGMVYNRNRMVLLKMDHGGQDHDYPPGQDPMELAVKAASAKM